MLAQFGSPNPSSRIHTRPVPAAVVTNHSLRTNCLGGTPLEMSMRNRPAVGPITAIAIAPRIG